MFTAFLRAWRLRRALTRLQARLDTPPEASARCLVHFLTTRAQLTRALRGFDPFYPVHDGNRAEVPPPGLLRPYLDEALQTQAFFDASAEFVRTSPSDLPPERYGVPYEAADIPDLLARADASALAALGLWALGRGDRRAEVGALYQVLVERAGPAFGPLLARCPASGLAATGRPDAATVTHFLALTHPWLAGSRAIPPAFD